MIMWWCSPDAEEGEDQGLDQVLGDQARGRDPDHHIRFYHDRDDKENDDDADDHYDDDDNDDEDAGPPVLVAKEVLHPLLPAWPGPHRLGAANNF